MGESCERARRHRHATGTQFAPCRCCNGTSFIRAMPREVAPMVGSGTQVTSPMAVTVERPDDGPYR